MAALTQGGGPPTLRSGGPCPGLLSRCPSGAPEFGGLLFVGTKPGDPKTHQGSDKPLCREASGVGLMDKVQLGLTFRGYLSSPDWHEI